MFTVSAILEGRIFCLPIYVGDSCNYRKSSAGAALCAPLEEIAMNFYTV